MMLDRPDAPSPSSFPRTLSKRPCCIIAELGLDEQDIVLDGIIRWMLPDRALFREATRYILKRQGDSVRLRVLGEDYPAVITGTSAEGYEIKFGTLIDTEVVDDLVSRHLTDE